MRTDQISIIQSSYRNLALNAEEFTSCFYAELFLRSPHLRQMFPDDISEQQNKLFQTFGVAVNSLGRFTELAPVLRDLGRRHIRYGVKPEHYDLVGQALLQALEKIHGDAFVSEMRAAWVDAYELISKEMVNVRHDSAA